MPILTEENLDTKNVSFYEYNAFLRGRAYYNEGRVTIKTFDGSTAYCRVRGTSGTYTVTLVAENKTQVKVSCECPQADRVHICKHIVASMLAVRDHIQQIAVDQWQYRLKLALENIQKRKTSSAPRNKFTILFGLQREKYADETFVFRLIPFRIKSQEWRGASDLEKIADRHEQNIILDKDRSWVHSAEVISSALDYRAVINLPLEGVHLYNIMVKLGGYYYGLTDFASYLPLLAKMDAPVFLMTTRNTFKERLQLQSDPVQVEAALARDEQGYSLQAGLNMNGETFTTIKNSLQILSADPAWVLAGHYIIPVGNPEALGFLSYFPLAIPAKDEQEFRDKYWQSIVEHIPVRGDVVSWVEVDADPIPRLYLRDESGKLGANLRFGYGEQEVDANPRADPVMLRDVPGSWGMVRIYRRKEQEEHFYQMLTDAHYGLKRAALPQPPGSFELRARTHPFDFLLHSIPA
jgi:non-specific serine/threonine protein kinase